MALSKSTESLSISIPSWLIEIIDEWCEANDFTRSKFFQRSARKYLLLKLDSPKLWERLYQDREE